MPMYDKAELTQKAKELHVVRDTLEKVCRLRDVLQFFDSSELLRDNLALKGGTAINLLFFNLPRLSVDIDLDFSDSLSREEMLSCREQINRLLGKQMAAWGYTLSPKSKTPHSLDSFVYDYINSAGVKDNIKIEINYSLRSHVLPTTRESMNSQIVDGDFEVHTLSPIEIYATKTVALMTRAAARDLYDLNYMIHYGLFDETELELYRKCVVFYLAIATETPPLSLDFALMEIITPHKVMTDLTPVVRDRDTFSLEEAKRSVKEFLKENVYLREDDIMFLKNFKEGYYTPELVFNDEEILERISSHPMAKWKTQRIAEKQGAESRVDNSANKHISVPESDDPEH